MPITLATEIDLHIEEFEGGLTALIYLGADIAMRTTVFADVSLTPLPGGGRHEFSFHILERNTETGHEAAYWSGKDTKHLFQEGQREFVLSLISGVAGIILTRLKPQRVQVITYDADLPTAALKKYSLLLEVFSRLGYDVTEFEPHHGKHLWWAERPPK